MKESQSYQNMLNEVEALVGEISNPSMDLDQLVNKVERGYHLIQSMKERLDLTKEKIDELHNKYTNGNGNQEH